MTAKPPHPHPPPPQKINNTGKEDVRNIVHDTEIGTKSFRFKAKEQNPLKNREWRRKGKK